MDIQDWSTTAGSNTDVDGTSIAEGMDPGLVNNAMRAIMANVAAYIALCGGAKVSGGTADVQTLTSGLSLTAYQQGLMIAFEAGSGLTNTGAMTMNVDSIAAKSVKMLNGSDPPAGAVTAGGIYLLAYESGADVLLLLTPNIAGALAAYLPLAGGTMSGELVMADQLLTRPKIKDYGESVNAIGSIGGGTQDIDLESGNVVTGTVDTSETTFTFSNPPASGTAGSFTLILTNGGSQTVNWPASVDWTGGVAPGLTSSGVDVLTFLTTDGGTTWLGFIGGLDMQ